jgi:hypothetical protein
MEIDNDENINNSRFNLEELIPTLKDKLNFFTKNLEDQVCSYEKTNVDYKNNSDDYINEYSSKTEYIQYSRTYLNRLLEIKRDLINQAQREWKNFKFCENILDMKGTVRIFF